MKRLYYVNNGGEYSDAHIYLIEEDPNEWDDLPRVLGLLSSWGHKAAKVEAVATKYQTTNASSAGAALNLERLFNHSEKKTPYARKISTWYTYYRPRRTVVSMRDAQKIAAQARASGRGDDYLDMLDEAIRRGAFRE